MSELDKLVGCWVARGNLTEKGFYLAIIAKAQAFGYTVVGKFPHTDDEVLEVVDDVIDYLQSLVPSTYYFYFSFEQDGFYLESGV